MPCSTSLLSECRHLHVAQYADAIVPYRLRITYQILLIRHLARIAFILHVSNSNDQLHQLDYCI